MKEEVNSIPCFITSSSVDIEHQVKLAYGLLK